MNTFSRLLVCLVLNTGYVSVQSSDAGFPHLSGPYFGQKPPGRRPEPFAPGIPQLFTQMHGIIHFSSDGQEAIWKPVWSPKKPLMMSRIHQGRWSNPGDPSFSELLEKWDVPIIAPDGKRILFLAYGSTGNRTGMRNCIWEVHKTREGWSTPSPLPGEINAMENISWQFSVDLKGNLYFGVRISDHGEGSIYCSAFKNGKYSKPEKLPKEINHPDYYTFSPYISPAGDYLLFSRELPEERYQLFISFRTKTGWTEGVNLNYIVGNERSLNGVVTSDGRYLFFLKCIDKNQWAFPYWVEASFIEELREQTLKGE